MCIINRCLKISMSYFNYKQVPVLPLDRYADADLAFIIPRVVELAYTAHDLAPWTRGLGYYDPLFVFDCDDLRYILDPVDVMGEDCLSETFCVLKNNEQREFGEYRTRRLAWNQQESGDLH